MAVTYDILTPLGQLRLLIGDQNEDNGVMPDGGNFDDAELVAILTRNSDDLNLAVADCIEILARTWARAVTTTTGPIRENLSDVAKAYERQAVALRAQYGGNSFAFAVGLERDDGYAAAAEESTT